MSKKTNNKETKAFLNSRRVHKNKKNVRGLIQGFSIFKGKKKPFFTNAVRKGCPIFFSPIID